MLVPGCARNGDLLGYAAQLSVDVAVFDRDRASIAVADRIRQDVDSGLAWGQVLGTPTLFMDGVVTAPATTRLPCWRAGPGKPLCSHALAEWRWTVPATS